MLHWILNRARKDVPESGAARPGRLFLAIGLLLAVLGVVGYAVQLSAHRLVVPWYLPIATTLGVISLVLALRQRRSGWRVLALVVVVLLAGAEWVFLVAGRLPAYTGPVAVGKSMPVFATSRADGSAFTQHDLEGGQKNVLVFFRGRW